MGMVNGFFNTSNFGKAMVDVGDDVAKSNLAQQLEKYRIEREQMAEASRERIAALRGGGRRGTGSRTGSAGGTPDSDPDDNVTFGVHTPEQRQAVTDRVNPDLSNSPFTPEARGERATAGKQAVGEYEEDQEHRTLRRNVARKPEAYDNYEKGRSERSARTQTLDAPTVDAARTGARKVNAYKGNGETDIKDSTVLNPFTGQNSPTAIGDSEIKLHEAQTRERGTASTENVAGADLKRRTDPNRSTNSTSRSLKDINDAIAKASDDVAKYETDEDFIRRYRRKPDAPEFRNYARAREERFETCSPGNPGW
jgi:hypothetical protein